MNINTALLKNFAFNVALFSVMSFVFWNIGFNRGADSAFCAIEVTVFEGDINSISSCQRVNTNAPFYLIRRNLPEIMK